MERGPLCGGQDLLSLSLARRPGAPCDEEEAGLVRAAAAAVGRAAAAVHRDNFRLTRMREALLARAVAAGMVWALSLTSPLPLLSLFLFPSLSPSLSLPPSLSLSLSLSLYGGSKCATTDVRTYSYA